MNPEKALNIIAGMCSKKEYCSQDVRNKLIKWEIPEKDIARLMQYLYQYQFVDDHRFARIYAEDKFRFNHWGKQKITMMLRQKNIPQDIIDEALSTIEKANYQEGCLTLLKQKLKSITDNDPYKQKAKLIRFGLGRGFDYETILQCLNLLGQEPEE